MTDTTKDAILPVLIRIQEDAAAFRKESAEFRKESAEFRTEVLGRLDRIEDVARKQRRDIAGILVMIKGAAGVFDERVTGLEQRVTVLEQRKN